MINIPHLADGGQKPAGAVGRGRDFVRIIHNGIVGGRITGIFGGIQLVLADGSGDDFLCPGVAAPVDVRCRVIVLFFSASIRGAATQLGSVNAPLTITVCGILQGNGIAVALLLTDTGGGVIGGIVFVMTGMEHDGDNACFLFFGQSFVFAYNIAVGKEVVPYLQIVIFVNRRCSVHLIGLV